MPEIRTYEQQYLPQGTYNAQATPDQMGAGIGAAISDLGETLDRIEKDKGEVWAYKTSSEAYTGLKQKYDEEINSIDPRDPEFNVKLNNATANFKSRIEQTTSSLMETAPSGYAKKALDRYMIQNSRSLMGEAIQRQASVSAEYMRAQLEDSVMLDAQSISESPDNANFERIVSAREEQIARLNIAPEAKIKWLSDIKRNLAKTQVMTLAKNDSSFLRKISPAGGVTATSGDGTSFGDAVAFVLKKEGGYTASDGNSGAPANFGINQRANPDIDVKNLTEKRAVEIYKERYWNAIGGDSLPKPMAMVAFNIAVNMGVSAAKELLEKSGNNPSVFTALAKQRYESIVANNPKQEPYLAGWLKRADETLSAATSPRNILPQVKMLPDEEIVSSSPPISGWAMLTPQERWEATRVAEGVASQKLNIEQAELTNKLQDVVTVLADGKEFPGIDDGTLSLPNLTRVFGPEKGKEAYETVETYKKVGAFVSTAQRLPIGQAQQLLSTFEPKPGPGYAEQAKIYKEMSDNFRKSVEQRAGDYMGWALNKEGTNVKPIDFSDLGKFRESLVARIPAATTAEQSHAVKTGLFSKGEVDAMGQILTRANPQDSIAFLREMRAATLGKDNIYTRTMSQLAEKVPQFAIAGDITARRGTVEVSDKKMSGETVAQMILAGDWIRRGNGVDDKDKTPRPLKLDQDKLNEKFYSKVGKAFALPDSRMGAAMAAQTLDAVTSYVAAKMMREGDYTGTNLGDHVEQAITAITGGKISYAAPGTMFSSTDIFLPWGMNKNTFMEKIPAALDKALKDNPPLVDVPNPLRNLTYVNAGRDGQYVLIDPVSRRVIPGQKGNIVVNVTQGLPGFYDKLGLPGVSDGR